MLLTLTLTLTLKLTLKLTLTLTLTLQWHARRLGAGEVARIFDPEGLMEVLAADPEQQVAEFGDSGPSRY